MLRKNILWTIGANNNDYQFSSVQFSSVQLLSCVQLLQPHGLRHVRPACPLPTPRAYSNWCPLHHWCHPIISSSCLPLLLLPSIFPRIRVFSSESAVFIRWAKYWSFSFSISPGVVIRIKGLNTYKAVSMFPDTGNRISISFTEILPSSVGLGFKLD